MTLATATLPPRVTDADFEEIYYKTTGEGLKCVDLFVKLFSFSFLFIVVSAFIAFVLFMLVDSLSFIPAEDKLYFYLIPSVLSGSAGSFWFVFMRNPDKKLLKRIWQYGIETKGIVTEIDHGRYQYPIIHFTYKDREGAEHSSTLLDRFNVLYQFFEAGSDITVYYLPEKPEFCAADCMALAENLKGASAYTNLESMSIDNIHLKSPDIIRKNYKLKNEGFNSNKILRAALLCTALFMIPVLSNSALFFNKSSLIWIGIFIGILIFSGFCLFVKIGEYRKFRQIEKIILKGNRTSATVEEVIASKEDEIHRYEGRPSPVVMLFEQRGLIVKYSFLLENGSPFRGMAKMSPPVDNKNISKGMSFPVYYLRDNPFENFLDIYGLTEDAAEKSEKKETK